MKIPCSGKSRFDTPIHHAYIIVFLIFSCETMQAQQPTISFFSPRSGTIGTTITITGDHFNTIPSQDVVYFGPVKAVVQSATVSQLSVLVPAGASYQPISITNTANGLTGWSSKYFQITFPGGDNYLSPASFDPEVAAPVQNLPNAIAVGDLDGDGRPDVVAIGDGGGSGSYLSVLRNTSRPGNISFAPSIDSNYAGFNGWAITLGDLNGDGLLDIIASSSQALTIYKNTSTPGNIHFSQVLTTSATIAFASSLQVGDMDKDGRNDLVFINGVRALTVMRNLSTPDSIQFADAQTILPPPSYAGDNLRIKIADFDGDGNTDVALAYTYVDSVVVVRNKSTPGNLVFDQVFKYNAGGGSRPYDLCVLDMDGDDKLDIAYTNNESTSVTVLKNGTTPASFDFNPFGGYCCVNQSGYIIPGDINGDGKPDLAFTGYICCFVGDVAISLNSSVPCNSNLTSTTVYDAGTFTQMVFADMDGDGKPDLVTGKNVQNAIGVRRNNISQHLNACVGDTTTIPASIAGTNYQWQQSNGGVFTDIADNVLFAGTTTPFLQIKNISTSLNNSLYRSIADGDTSNVLSVAVNSSLVPAISIGNCPQQECSGDPTTAIYASTQNAGASPTYYWQDSTDVQGWKSIGVRTLDSLQYVVTVDGSKIRCMLVSNVRCATPDSAFSNVITLRITPAITPSNLISGVTAVNVGQSTTLTATPTNGGYWPQYQWQDSTSAAGWKNVDAGNSSSVIYAPGKSGDKVRCILRSSGTCASPKTVYSNALVFTVNVITAINTLPGSNYRILLYPNPSNTVLTIDSLNLSDNWQTLEIFGLNGQKRLSTSLMGVTNKTIEISSIAPGLYLAVLKRKNNQFASYEFVKLSK